MTGRIVIDAPKDGVSQPLVKAAGLKAEGIEPCTGAAAPHSFRLRLPYQAAAKAGAAQRLGKLEKVDVKEGE
jgi:hypothetical protein